MVRVMTTDKATPNALYPPTLLATAKLAELFDPTRVSFPWHRLPVPPTATVASSAPLLEPDAPIHNGVNAANRPMPYEMVQGTGGMQSMQSMSHTTQPLSPELTKKIFDFVRTRDAARVADKRSTRMFERFSMAIGAADPRTVTTAWLKQHEVTLQNLIVDCQVSVIDLYKARIIASDRELIDFGFTLAMLTLNPRCLNVQQVNICFHINSTHPLIVNLRVSDLLKINPPLGVDDLLTLGATAESLLTGYRAETTDARILAYCGLTATDWQLLGITREQLLALKLTPSHCRDMGAGWEAAEVAKTFAFDAAWLASR
jgi:hypothetical protein